MENETSQLISSFIEISGGQTEETAVQFLEATSWNLEDAVNLFLISRRNPSHRHHQTREKIPSIKDTLYDDFMCPTSVAVCPEDVWDDSTPEEPSDSRLSSLYRPPLDLLFNGSFEKAKATASIKDLWLLVNLQSTIEFASHTLNRDLWSNDTVSQAIGSGFVLWQVYDDTNEGQKISTFYKIDSAPPVILLIDPITGQKMRTWSGMIEAHGFLEDLMKYRDVGPHEHVASLTSNRRIKTEKVCFLSSQADDNDHQDMSTFWDDDRVVTTSPSWGKEFDETCLSSDDVFEFPVLTEEPKGDCDRSLLCSLCIRFPDGRRKQRKFLKSEPIQLLWSFCYSNMEDSEKRAFKLVQAIPGATKTLDYGAKATFDQSGIDNSIVSVTWE